jgi:hypothetical protein
VRSITLARESRAHLEHRPLPFPGTASSVQTLGLSALQSRSSAGVGQKQHYELEKQAPQVLRLRLASLGWFSWQSLDEHPSIGSTATTYPLYVMPIQTTSASPNSRFRRIEKYRSVFSIRLTYRTFYTNHSTLITGT